MLKFIKHEILATWTGGSPFDRTLMVAFALLIPYDAIQRNWFDAILAVIVMAWIWQSVKANSHG